MSSQAFAPGWYAVHFKSARFDSRRANGEPWHTSPSDNTAVLVGGLIGLAVGYPTLGLSLGKAASDKGGDPLAPAPFVDLKIDDVTYRVSPVGRTYAPAWNQPIAIDARRRHGNEQVIIQVRDGVDDSMIAQYETTLAELLAAATRTFTAPDSVSSIDVAVAAMPGREPAEYVLHVPSTMSLESLAATGATGWHPIPVWNGDTVTIEATGAVCPSSRRECFDPNGAEPGRWKNYSYFPELRHASLVALAPGNTYGVGASGAFQVAQSGSVLLFVNDTDVRNNDGAFEARVVVMPPP